MFTADVAQELQGVAIARINPGKNQIDVIPLHKADRHSIVCGVFNDVAQRLQHRGQEGQSGRIRIKNQDTKLVHGIQSLVRCPCRYTKPVHPP